jgi:hypothetical protein
MEWLLEKGVIIVVNVGLCLCLEHLGNGTSANSFVAMHFHGGLRVANC